MKRLVCIVEGHGDVRAVPVLCNRILRSLLDVSDWYVDEDPVRFPRSHLVDESKPAPKRPVNVAQLGRALSMAAIREPGGILVCCDADDDCPAAWSASAPAEHRWGGVTTRVRCVMACREYESWLLCGFPHSDRQRARALQPDRAPRDAKRALAKLVPKYTPSTDQARLTRELDLRRAWARSDSLDKLVRCVAALVECSAPERPDADS